MRPESIRIVLYTKVLHSKLQHTGKLHQTKELLYLGLQSSPLPSIFDTKPVLFTLQWPQSRALTLIYPDQLRLSLLCHSASVQIYSTVSHQSGRMKYLACEYFWFAMMLLPNLPHQWSVTREEAAAGWSTALPLARQILPSQHTSKISIVYQSIARTILCGFPFA